MKPLQEIVSHRKRWLAHRIEAELAHLAQECADRWSFSEDLDVTLKQGLQRLPHCQLLYVLNGDFRQCSSNVGPLAVEAQWRGQDLSARPYLQGLLPYRGLVLSSVYLSNRSLEPCISGLHAIQGDDGLLGFVVADFPVRDLPLPAPHQERVLEWNQYKGDPSIRGLLFQQQRSASEMDTHIDAVHAVVRVLMAQHGVFHVKLHYSSARVTLWLHSDPFDYRIHSLQEIINPDICLVYTACTYADKSRVKRSQIELVLQQFVELRNADDTVYLRSASLNLMNGRVGLTFSCDGSHYLSVDEFLSKRAAFWLRGESRVVQGQAGGGDGVA